MRQAVFTRPSRFQFIVGYLGNTANASGNTMMAPTFLSVNSETGCTLADLAVTGYDAPKLIDEEEGEWDGGCAGGDFVLNFLTSSGTLEARYYWIDDGDSAAGWYASSMGAAISGGASSIAIPAGQGVWIHGSGMTLQTAGQVNTAIVAKKMNTSGNTATGNCMPIDHTLGKVYVTGYEAPKLIDEEEGEWDGGCAGGDFVLNFLTSSGTLEARYYWIDDGDTSAGWYSSSMGAPISGGATSVAIPAGKGLWVHGGGMYLNIPAPEL